MKKRDNPSIQAEIEFIQTCVNAHQKLGKTINGNKFMIAAVSALAEDFLVGNCMMVDENKIDFYLDTIKKNVKSKFVLINDALKAKRSPIN